MDHLPLVSWSDEYFGAECERAISVDALSYLLLGREEALEQLLGNNFIMLQEQTVSGQHAVLQVHRLLLMPIPILIFILIYQFL